MHTPSIRTLAAIAYERGEEFDPALMLSPSLAERLASADISGAAVLSGRTPDVPGKAATGTASDTR